MIYFPTRCYHSDGEYGVLIDQGLRSLRCHSMIVVLEVKGGKTGKIEGDDFLLENLIGSSPYVVHICRPLFLILKE